MQEIFWAARRAGSAPDALLLLHHPPVVTLGRGADRAHILAGEEELRRRGILLFETGRGGDVTFHGPSQLIGYPIVDLRPDRMDLVRYARDLEEVLIAALADIGVEARREAGATGVWAGGAKIAAIGVRVARWITSHGFALNVGSDLSGFETIVPCGLAGRDVTSVSRVLGREVGVEEAVPAVAARFAELFGRRAVEGTVERESAQVWIARREADGPRFLLLHRCPARGSIWQPVTGTMEAGETPEACARREVLEETGIRLDEVVDLDYAQTFAADPRFYGTPLPRPTLNREHAFAALSPSANARLDPAEHDDARWVGAEEASRLVHFEANRESLRRALAWIARGGGAPGRDGEGKRRDP
jgi:lipoyl(octanoyl) transferase